MAGSGAGRFNFRNGTVRIEDANGLSYTIAEVDGDFSGGEEAEGNVDVAIVRCRGDFDALVKTDSMIQSNTLTMQMINRAFTSAVVATIWDVINKRGVWASAVSVVDGGVWAVKMIVDFDDGAGNVAQKLYPVCRLKGAWSEGNPVNTIAISMDNYDAPVDS